MATTRYALSRHAALKVRAQGHVLVLPERAIRLEGSGGEILELVDGTRSRDEITSVLAERYPGTEGLADEVDRFLGEMITMGAITSIDADGESG